MRRISGPLRLLWIALVGAACGGLATACSHPPPVAAPPSAPPRPPSDLLLTFRAQKESYRGRWTATTLEQERKVLERRVCSLNPRSVKVVARMPDQLTVTAYGVPNAEQTVPQLQIGTTLQFYWLQQLGNENGTRRPVWRVVMVPAADGKGTAQVLTDVETGMPVTASELERQVFSQPPIIGSKDLLPKCRASLLPSGYPVIEFELNKEGAETFKTFTRHHIGERLAIFLNKKLLTTPTVNGVIKGKGIIEGNLTLDAARSAADQLNAGALPVPLILLESRPLEP